MILSTDDVARKNHIGTIKYSMKSTMNVSIIIKLIKKSKKFRIIKNIFLSNYNNLVMEQQHKDRFEISHSTDYKSKIHCKNHLKG